MKARQANKIIRQSPLPEGNPKAGKWWDRYHRAYAYTEKLDRRYARRLKASGHTFISDEEIDELCNRLLKGKE